MTMTTVADLLHHAATQGLPRMDAQMLLLHALDRPTTARAWLIAHADTPATPAQTARWQDLLQRRLHGEPVAYLVGHKEFFGLPLTIDARVLDPRPDTETLVEWALAQIPPTRPCHAVDLGTGSGAIALALRSQRPLLHMTATDASAEALAVAQANAAALQLPLRLLQAVPDAAGGHWFDAVPGERFDLIVSNPPYIAEGDPHLAALRHEPALALTSGHDGLDAIRAIVAHAPAHLHPGGWLLLEHGRDQADAVQALLRQRGYAQVQGRADLGGVPRCSGGQWPEI